MPGEKYQQRGEETEKIVTAGETESEKVQKQKPQVGERREMGSLGCSPGCTSDLKPLPSQQHWRAALVIKGDWQQAGVITMTTSFCHLRCPVLSYRNLNRTTQTHRANLGRASED